MFAMMSIMVNRIIGLTCEGNASCKMQLNPAVVPVNQTWRAKALLSMHSWLVQVHVTSREHRPQNQVNGQAIHTRNLQYDLRKSSLETYVIDSAIVIQVCLYMNKNTLISMITFVITLMNCPYVKPLCSVGSPKGHCTPPFAPWIHLSPFQLTQFQVQGSCLGSLGRKTTIKKISASIIVSSVSQ